MKIKTKLIFLENNKKFNFLLWGETSGQPYFPYNHLSRPLLPGPVLDLEIVVLDQRFSTGAPQRLDLHN